MHCTAALGSWDPCSSVRSGHTPNPPDTPDHSGLAPPVAMYAVVTSSCLMLAPHLAQSRPSLPVTSDQLILLLQWLVAGGATMQHPELQTLLRSTLWSTDLDGVIPFVVFTLQLCFSCSYLPLICLFTNQNIQLIHSLLIRIEWTTGNEILIFTLAHL